MDICCYRSGLLNFMGVKQCRCRAANRTKFWWRICRDNVITDAALPCVDDLFWRTRSFNLQGRKMTDVCAANGASLWCFGTIVDVSAKVTLPCFCHNETRNELSLCRVALRERGCQMFRKRRLLAERRLPDRWIDFCAVAGNKFSMFRRRKMNTTSNQVDFP